MSDLSDPAALLADLVRIPSVGGSPAESRIQHHLADWMEAAGLEVDHWRIDLDGLASRPDFPGMEVPRTEAWGLVGRLPGSGGGPSLIEGKTYRTRPHAEGMRDGGYRTVEEIEAWKERDPITFLEARLLDREIATQAQIDEVRQEIEDVVAEGLEFAKNSPYPEPDTAALHIYGAS